MNNIKFNFSGVMADKIGTENGLTADDIKSAFQKLSDVKIDYPFMKLVDDKETVSNILTVAETTRCRFKNLVVLGIGGSALGLRSLAQALLPPQYNLLDSKERGGRPRLFVCDNIDPDYFGGLLKHLDWKETCVTVISKSGKTTETMAQYYILRDILLKKLSAKRWKENVIIISDPEDGPLRAIAKQEGIQSFAVPKDVGGRFSILSSVGLFPAAVVGIDIVALLEGAKEMAEECKKLSLEENPAIKNAVVHYALDTKKRKNISVMMPYSDSLALFADWYVQLWAESLGKQGKGPTPVKALGATDQHSQIQLYMEGPADKVITIMGTEKFQTALSIPTDVAKDFDYIAGKDLGLILNAERMATASALKEAKRPVVEINISEVTAKNLGALFMMYQIQTAVAGLLYGINPFDQPGVELGKKLTREILSK